MLTNWGITKVKRTERNDQGDNDNQRILQGRFDIGLDFGFMFYDVDQPVEDAGDAAAEFSCPQHTAI